MTGSKTVKCDDGQVCDTGPANATKACILDRETQQVAKNWINGRLWNVAADLSSTKWNQKIQFEIITTEHENMHKFENILSLLFSPENEANVVCTCPYYSS